MQVSLSYTKSDTNFGETLVELSSFGEWLRRQRKALDLTQEQLAQRISCSTSALRKIEAEQRRPSEQIVEQLADLFHIASDQRASFLKFARGDQEAAPTGATEEEASWRVSQPRESKPSSPPSGTVTFLFTDIEESTKLAQQHAEANPVLLARHHEILHTAIQAQDGYAFQVVGDSFAAAFHSASDALNAALNGQYLLHKEAWSPAPIKVRMGLHTGAAQLQAASQAFPYLGYATIALTQRIMSAAYGGQILLSQTARELVWEQLPSDVTLLDMGEHRLKDFLHPIHLYQVTAPDLPADFPPLKTLDSFPNNLPAQLTTFIGREQEIAEVKEQLEPHRLVTLTGPGGTGKTRLALQIGAEMLEHFQNGVWLVELASITDAAFIVHTAMAVLGITAQRDRPALETLKDYLRAKSLLLILDNCEHLVEACARFVESILQAAPNVKILATSREALGILGEQIYSVPPLSTPGSKQPTAPEELTKFESIQLFMERAMLVSPNFRLTKDNAYSIAQICLRLDGIPLAIELAAARIRSMPVEQITAHIDDRFRLLTGSSRTALPRHQTLRSLIEWSYHLLTEPERILLRRLAVFLGAWTLESAEAVCAGETIDSFAVMDLLSKLVEKSLVLLDNTGRYKFLETIRQYAREKLLESGEIEAIRQEHLTYFLTYAEMKGTETQGSNQIAALKQLDEEYENIREAMDWAIETGQVEEATQIGQALGWLYWWSRALFQEAYEKLTRIINHPATTKEKRFRATALTFATLYWYAGPIKWDAQQAQAMIEEAIEILKLAGEKEKNHLAMTYGFWGFCMIGQDNTVAENALDIGLSLAWEVNDRIGLANLTEIRGYLARIQKAYSRALEFSNESIRLFREIGDYYGIARGLGNIGWVFYLQGDYHGAQKYLEEALAIYRNFADKPNSIWVLGYLGRIAVLNANYGQASELFEEELFLAKDSGLRQRIGTCTRELAYLHLYEGNPASALAFFRESLSFIEMEDKVEISLCLAGIASAIFQLSPQHAEHAAQLLGWAQSMIDKIGIDNLPYEKEQITKALIAVREQLGSRAFESAFAEGQKMSLDEALNLALKTVQEM